MNEHEKKVNKMYSAVARFSDKAISFPELLKRIASAEESFSSE